MSYHYDLSAKDKKYFIDGSTYNCPFCNRRNVRYSVKHHCYYDMSNTKKTHCYFIQCSDQDCKKISLHLSYYELVLGAYRRIEFPPEQVISRSESSPLKQSKLCDKEGNSLELDELFFYHQPSSVFSIDNRIPNSIREPLGEANDCLKLNHLTGASGCLRKAIYKLFKFEKIPAKKGNQFLKYEVRVDQLKKKYPKIDGELFDNLKSVFSVTSQELHEDDWEDFDSHQLRLLLEVTQQILGEIFVIPDEKEKRRNEISTLKIKAKSKSRIKDVKKY